MLLAYLDVIALVERPHRQFLEVVKLELDTQGVHDINNVQAMILFNIGDPEMTVGELTLRGCYLGSNVSYNVKKMSRTTISCRSAPPMTGARYGCACRRRARRCARRSCACTSATSRPCRRARSPSRTLVRRLCHVAPSRPFLDDHRRARRARRAVPSAA